VVFGVRDPQADKVRQLLERTGAGATAAPVAEAVRTAEVVALATPWERDRGGADFGGIAGGKDLSDCTNPLKFTPGVGLELALGFSESGAEHVARWAAGARVVKAFNTYGYENFANASYPNAAGLRPVMFVAADDPVAKAMAAQLAGDIGFEAFDAGGLRAARELEPLALIWIRAAMSGERSANFTWARLRR